MGMSTSVPSHVSPELVVDLDIYNLPLDGEDVQLAWRKFQGRGPLVYSPYNGGHWVPTTAEDISVLFRDTERLSNASISIPAHDGPRFVPSESDPPDLMEYRRNVVPHFSPAAIAKLEPDIRALAIELIEGLRPRGECEFVSEFAHQLPVIVFLRMMGLPLADKNPLVGFTEIMARSPDPQQKHVAYGNVVSYVDGWIRKRRAEPGDDLITHMTRAQIRGQPYPDHDVLSSCVLLLLGGLDTVASMLGFIAAFLAREPQQRRYIREHPDELFGISEELIRRFAVANLGRVVAMDFTYKGVTLRKGDRLLLSSCLHNIDESRFVNAAHVDFHRKPQHISFGSGAHACIGAFLARTEIKIFLQEWLTRIPDFALSAHKPQVARSGSVNGMESLRLTWRLVQ